MLVSRALRFSLTRQPGIQITTNNDVYTGPTMKPWHNFQGTYGFFSAGRWSDVLTNDQRSGAWEWYTKHYTEAHSRTKEQGWMRPYEGDPMGFTQKPGGIAWGHYIPSHDPNVEPGLQNNAVFDRMKPHFRFDRRPYFRSMRFVTNLNDHNWFGDYRNNQWKGWKYHFNTPQVDRPYRGTQRQQTPPFLLASNWKPVTEAESTAQKERLEIAGRNRRYYWKLMYHPINFKWFHPHSADTMWVKYARANHEMTGLWGDDHNRTDGLHSYFKWCIIPALFFCWYEFSYRNTRENSTHRSYIGHTSRIMYDRFGVKPLLYGFNFEEDTTDMQPDDYIFNWNWQSFLSLLTWSIDDRSRMRWEQYDHIRRATEDINNHSKDAFYAGSVRSSNMLNATVKTGGKDPLALEDHFRPEQDKRWAKTPELVDVDEED
jgi:hypothetical protein